MKIAAHRRIWLILILLLLGLIALALPSLVSQSDWIPQVVDTLRGLPFIGPERVAAAEDTYYQIRDQWDQWVYRNTHSPSVPTAREQATELPEPTAPPNADHANQPVTRTPMPSGPREAVPITAACPRLLTSLQPDPQLGEGIWTSADMPLGSRTRPPLCHTFLRPDSLRPYARVDLVRVDLTQTSLMLVPGTKEPRPVDGIPGSGQIPIAAQNSGKLLAAWNGGFLTLHGAYGMMVDRRVILPPKDGLATLALYSDGRMKLGEWGREITTTADLVSFRQNGALLVDQGQVKGSDYYTWGKSVSGNIFIWRSGLGMTADGALVIAIGNSQSAATLGQALRQAGAVQAMQLDVNAWHVFFYTYELKPAGLAPTKLNRDLPGSTQVFLKPYDRDFMYLTVK